MRLLRTVRALPEPTIALLFNGVKEVSADNFGGSLGTLAFLLTEDFFQFVTIPISVSFLGLLAVVCVDILLGSTTVQCQIVGILTTLTLDRRMNKMNTLSHLPALKKGQITDLGSSPKAS